MKRIEPLALAQMFHEAYERLAPQYGYKTREASAVPWQDVPLNNKYLMEATCKAVIEQLETAPVEVSLYAHGVGLFPVDVELSPVFDDPSTIPPAPPISDNPRASFNFAPVDKQRLEQLLGFLRAIGFATQTLSVKYMVHEYTMIEVVFGQVSDPRLEGKQ